MVKISVIVAVYQVEQYIVRCLDSLLNQTFKDFEVLLIDDGSVDSSGQICDEYARRDNRFRVYHQRNEGVGSARQFGIEKSAGEYTIHVDPDDWIEPNMLEELYSTAVMNNADLVICDYYNDSEKTSSYVAQKPDLSTSNGYFEGLFNNALYGACWNKLVRKKCYIDYNISFSKDMVLWEDKLVNLKLAEKPIIVTYLSKAFYHYIIRPNSSVRMHSAKRVYSIMRYINWLEKDSLYCKKENLTKLKIFAKIDAFQTNSISCDEFKNIYPEINRNFKFKISEIGFSLNFYMFLALNISLPLSRGIFSVGKKFLSFIGCLWRK